VGRAAAVKGVWVDSDSTTWRQNPIESALTHVWPMVSEFQANSEKISPVYVWHGTWRPRRQVTSRSADEAALRRSDGLSFIRSCLQAV
jgi:hypothetical protein